MEILKEISNKIKNTDINKSIQNLIIVGLMGIAIILAASFFFTSPQEEEAVALEVSTEKTRDTSYEARIKSELEEILSQIEGVGEVNVMLTIANERESEIAYSKTASQSITQENDNQGGERVTDQNNVTETAVMINENGENKPFVTRENRPEIKGIMVVAEGAQNPDVKYRLSQAVQVTLDLPSFKVVIYAKES